MPVVATTSTIPTTAESCQGRAACTADELVLLANGQEAKSHHPANRYGRRNRPEYPDSRRYGDERDNAHGLNALSALVVEGSTPSCSSSRMLSRRDRRPC